MTAREVIELLSLDQRAEIASICCETLDIDTLYNILLLNQCLAMKRVFAPYTTDPYWMGADTRADGHRILALCFMAALAAEDSWDRRNPL